MSLICNTLVLYCVGWGKFAFEGAICWSETERDCHLSLNISSSSVVVFLKNISHKNENVVIIYSSACVSKCLVF